MDKKLYRDTQNKMVGGVASGLAGYFDVNVTWVRLAFILLLFAELLGILIYIVLWIVLPGKPYNPFEKPAEDAAAYGAPAQQSYDAPRPPPQATPGVETFFREKARKENNRKMVAGVIFVVLGTIFLIRQFDLLPWWFSFVKLWPLALILPGIAILVSAMNPGYTKPPSTTGQQEKPSLGPADNQPVN
jgi:phage shock protein PspC (stress-responsive transcriptional regulator)